jgi:hypothetical protein
MKGAIIQQMTTTIDTSINHAIIARLIEVCYREEDMDKKVQILYKINSLLPKTCCVNIPSLITNDYIDTTLYRIEQNIHSITASAWS